MCQAQDDTSHDHLRSLRFVCLRGVRFWPTEHDAPNVAHLLHGHLLQLEEHEDGALVVVELRERLIQLHARLPHRDVPRRRLAAVAALGRLFQVRLALHVRLAPPVGRHPKTDAVQPRVERRAPSDSDLRDIVTYLTSNPKEPTVSIARRVARRAVAGKPRVPLPQYRSRLLVQRRLCCLVRVATAAAGSR